MHEKGTSLRGARASAFTLRAVLAALTWYALTDGATSWDAWVIGVPAVLFAAALGTALLPPFDWSWRGAFKFVAFFLRESWSGGVDVARRAFDPRMPLAPGLFEHPLAVPSDLTRVAVANTSSLLPGSLVVDVDSTRLLIHALDVESPSTRRTVAATEAAVAEMFAVGPLQRPHGDPQRGRE